MPKRRIHVTNRVPPGGRVIGGAFGLMFLGVGVTILVMMWGAPMGDFHSPPLPFRIIGSFMALVCVTVGGAILLASIKGVAAGVSVDVPDSPHDPNRPQANYTCSKCAAPLADDIDVSPHGDVKCTYCGSWFNIHAE